MQYFKLVTNVIDGVEFQHWGLIARDDKEYEKNGHDKDPYVISKDKIPKYKFNLSVKVIDKNGVFHNRSSKDFNIGKKLIVKENKQNELKSIDVETSQKLMEGFKFDEHIFSLSTNAQLNWQNIVYSLNLSPDHEFEISTLNDGEYVLKYEDINLFRDAYVKTLNEILKKCRDKKKNLLNTSVTEYLKNNKELSKTTNMF